MSSAFRKPIDPSGHARTGHDTRNRDLVGTVLPWLCMVLPHVPFLTSGTSSCSADQLWLAGSEFVFCFVGFSHNRHLARLQGPIALLRPLLLAPRLANSADILFAAVDATQSRLELTTLFSVERCVSIESHHPFWSGSKLWTPVVAFGRRALLFRLADDCAPLN